MGDNGSNETQRSVVLSVAEELAAAGFVDAKVIGRGGFGVVYRCDQLALGRSVAVKVLTSVVEKEDRARFFREQQAMARLTGHPNIVNILHVGMTTSGLPFIVMPFHPQDSLETRIRRHGPLPLADALTLGVKIAGAVEAAHRLGILHRDIKPANILLTDYGGPALGDFGIAQIVGGFHTGTGTISGSPAFTAPEVLRGDPPSSASDVYSIGATLFSALTGHAAFERHSGEQIVAQFLRITTAPIPDLREHGIDDDISAVIASAMASAHDDRPSTAAALGDSLREVQLRHGLPQDDMALHTIHDRKGEALALPAITTNRTPTNAAGNLPQELTSFVGRRHEIAQAKNLLSVSPMVTLTGIGGVGKTRLALQLASNRKRAFRDGLWLVELADIRDKELVVNEVAEVFGLNLHSVRRTVDLLIEYLVPRELLLIFDNCEQVISAVAELAETLLRACPGLRILATSREPVGIAGESTLRVPPLTVPDPAGEPSLDGMPSYDAVTLFVDRAIGALPTFTLNRSNQTAVARICQQLDGLPLPIELAAARLRTLSPEQILRRLTDRYALLTRGHRGAPSRQQTLRLCIDWSFDLCTALEQRVWGRLSVFAGGAELDVVEHVCGDGLNVDELLDAVSSLVDKSILIREESGSRVRLRMLETLREYGREKLTQSDEYSVLRYRHRDWCKKLLLDAESQWISSRQLDWAALLGRELSNIREALEFCTSVGGESEEGLEMANAMYSFWMSRALLGEGRRWLERLLACEPMRPTMVRVEALFTASELAEFQGDTQAGRDLVEVARALAAQSVDPAMHAVVDHASGLLALFSGDLSHARTDLEKALMSSGSRADGRKVNAQFMLGVTYEQLGELDRAIECHERVIAITEARGELVWRSNSLWAVAVAVWRQGDRVRAVGLLEHSLRLAREATNTRTAAVCLEALGWIVVDEPDARRAAVLMGAAEGLETSIGSNRFSLPHMLHYHDRCEREARRMLGETTFEADRGKGARMGFQAAIAYGLGESEQHPSPRATVASVRVTRRERQVADLIAEGLSNKAIAARLVISPRTAQGHVEHLLTKLGFHSRAQIAAWVAEQK